MKLSKLIAKKIIKGYRAKQVPKIEKPEEIKSTTIPESEEEILVKKEPEISSEEPKSETTGVRLPQIPTELTEIRIEQKPLVEKAMTYPLIPRKPAKGETVFAYAKIFWDKAANKYVYQLVEPQLTAELEKMYKKIKELLEEKLDVDFTKLKKIEAKDYLSKQTDEIIKIFRFNIGESNRQTLKYYIERDFTGLGKIEPLMQDPNIEDISCDGLGVPIFIFHRDPSIGSIITNILFDNSDELDSFVIRLAQLCGKSISVAQPLLDGSLPDGSRLQTTLATDIARRGSNFSIRKFSEEPLTPVHLLNYGTTDISILAYLWFVVDYGRSILISGGTASGKTTFLNVLSLFIRPEKKIISIEDTPEIRLPHTHWVPSVARTAISAEGLGEVDLFELLKGSLRQRPDYIVVGEVRGKEAYILFQQMAMGHPSLATIHAENTYRLIDRLTTPPISLPPTLIKSVDLLIFLARMKYKDKFVRKTVEILEVVDFDVGANTPVVNTVFKWNPLTDKFDMMSNSILLKRISELSGMAEEEIIKEIERRMVVLGWMRKNNITDYRDVYKIFSVYYSDPRKLLTIIGGGGA